MKDNGKSVSDEDFKIFQKVFRDSIYIGSFRTPQWQTSASYYGIQIGDSFIKQWDNWANGNSIEKRNKIGALKNELKELFGFDTFEIAVAHDKKKLIVNTDDGSFFLDELGSGLLTSS